MLKFIGYVVKYKKNMAKLSRLEAEVEILKNESEWYEHKANQKNNALRQINNLLAEYEKGGPVRTKLYKDIREVVDQNVEKKLLDDILLNYTSNSK